MKCVRNFAAAAAMSFGILGCGMWAGGSSDQGNAIAGGSSDQGNAIHVAVRDSAGRAVAGAVVVVLPSDWIGAGTPGPANGLPKSYRLTTDSNGVVAGRLAKGTYVVTVSEGSLRGYGEVANDDSVDVLVHPGPVLALSGTLSAIRTDSLAIPGTGRMIPVDSMGRFRADSLPAGVHRLATRDGKLVLLDSLAGGTIADLGTLPTPGSGSICSPKTILVLPPVLSPGPGVGYAGPLRVMAHTSYPGAIMERTSDTNTAWSSMPAAFYLDSSTTFWIRARVPGGRSGLAEKVAYAINPAPSLAGLLPLDSTRPTGTLQSWAPDSVWAAGDTVWILSVANSCDALPTQGVSGWHHADTLDLYRRECPGSLGGPVRILLHLPSISSIWTVSTLQPAGYNWNIP